MSLKGKAALVTGGGTGLGRAITLQLAREGVNVAVNYSRSAGDAEKTAAEASALGVKAVPVKADVSSPEEAERLVATSAELLGGLDILINNAGTTKFAPFQDLDGLNPEDFTHLFQTNAMSIYFASRAAAKIMNSRGGGHIVSTVSIAGFRPTGSSIAYAVSKAAGIHMTKCLAVALAPSIKVNAVAPGLLMTRWVAGFNDEHIKKMEQQTLLKRTADVEECASVFLNLVKNNSITGQILSVDCGQSV
ncbi:MAG: SDR family oxidoreductase [Treponema sp.]|nr:SDR family oxidoreductase [Treponema sp.]